ncbi:MAG TPA: glycosyltransferase [Candidatus Binatia bacterium]|nr:glycosyltransferase [Candidatus Binatia bacterium]
MREADSGPLANLRVAIEVRSLDRGGLETVVAQLVRGLPAHGIEPVVLCTERGGELADRLLREGHSVEVLTGDDRAAELAETLRRYDVRLLNPHYSTLGTPIAASLNVPVVVTLHNAYGWLGAALYDDVRVADRHVSAYVAVSEWVAEFSARRFRIERDRIAVVRNGVAVAAAPADDAVRTDARRRLGIAADAELVLAVGAISRVKCQLALVDAVSELAESRPRLLAWLVGGEMEPDYAERVRARIAERGLAERILLAGQRDDVTTILAAADVFALPSIVEGLSLAAVEALAMGVPAVLTRTGDADYLLGEAREPSDSPQPLAGAIVDAPEVDPFATDWRSLRDIAGADHPPHARALAGALARMLDDLPARRAAARARWSDLSAELSTAEMCRRTASLLLRVAASHGAARAALLDEERALLAAELDRERAASGELRATVARLEHDLDVRLDDVRGRLAEVMAEVRTTSRTSWQLLQLTTRILDKLRISHRARQAVRSLGVRMRLAATRYERANGSASGSATAPANRGGAAAPTSLMRSPGPRRQHWLIFAVVPFDDIGGAQRSAQLARALVREGCSVTYVARFARSESIDLGIGAASGGVECREWDPSALRAWLTTLEYPLRVLVELPEADVVDLAEEARRRGARVLYDKIDAWESCVWASWFAPDVERRMLATADGVVASARSLQSDLARGGRDVHLLANAVDPEVFAASARDPDGARDLVRGERTLVYAGSLWGDWFDWDLVAGTARARPTWRVNLIGDPPAERFADLPANIHFLGLKPQTALPEYYAAADACLIPFRRGPVVDAVNPLKVYEYLAMRRPVVATSMPELRDVPYVFTADDAETTVAAVERACATPPPLADIEGFVAANTWGARAKRLREIAARPTIAVIVLCYNNADVIGRCVESLVRHRGDDGYRIAVVDNGSTDGSLDVLHGHEALGDIQLVRNSRNGCSSGRNLGLAATASEIVVFLDSDQWATRDGWLDPALDILREHREIGAVAWNAGWFDPGSGRGPIVDYLPERGMSGRYATARFRTDVAYLATSGFVAPRSVLARTAGFDEFYDPTCFEDTDLSFQIKSLGYEIAYCPAIGVGHRPHATTGSLDDYKSYLLRNEQYFLEKWRGHPEFFFGVPDAG